MSLRSGACPAVSLSLCSSKGLIVSLFHRCLRFRVTSTNIARATHAAINKLVRMIAKIMIPTEKNPIFSSET